MSNIPSNNLSLTCHSHMPLFGQIQIVMKQGGDTGNEAKIAACDLLIRFVGILSDGSPHL